MLLHRVFLLKEQVMSDLYEAPKHIDPKTIKRAAHFEYFNSMANPYAGVTAHVDITPMMEARKRIGAPFFLSMVYIAAQAANSIPELRQRISGNEILEFKRCPSSHTVAKEDETYAYCVLKNDMPFDEFLPMAIEAQEKCKKSGTIEEDDTAIAYFFISSLPWISYAAITQPTPVPADSNPRITWGKYFEENGKTLLPVTLLVHHALCDGRHIAAFFHALDREIRIFADQFTV